MSLQDMIILQDKCEDLEERLRVATECADTLFEILDVPERNQDDHWYEQRQKATDLYHQFKD